MISNVNILNQLVYQLGQEDMSLDQALTLMVDRVADDMYLRATGSDVYHFWKLNDLVANYTKVAEEAKDRYEKNLATDQEYRQEEGGYDLDSSIACCISRARCYRQRETEKIQRFERLLEQVVDFSPKSAKLQELKKAAIAILKSVLRKKKKGLEKQLEEYERELSRLKKLSPVEMFESTLQNAKKSMEAAEKELKKLMQTAAEAMQWRREALEELALSELR